MIDTFVGLVNKVVIRITPQLMERDCNRGAMGAQNSKLRVVVDVCGYTDEYVDPVICLGSEACGKIFIRFGQARVIGSCIYYARYALGFLSIKILGP